ncbi:protein FAR1-RELATED SEQUENCE 5-like [Spinacia oleracea]|uniref:Protein FAR1-RELATED SEQUENCE 5-like n=1 Tax=Spinacia oleracea TaxID=3562 RepID=A0ABM3RPY1_SPIOL|nr:protein FAR1-RELATED SEQUENCE 5-like [Spinacia oleracea]
MRWYYKLPSKLLHTISPLNSNCKGQPSLISAINNTLETRRIQEQVIRALFLFVMATAEVDLLSHSSSSSVTSYLIHLVFTSLSPGGTREWIPSCSEELKPIVGMNFKDPEEGLSFYKAYATASGFTSRKSTTTRRKKTDVVAFQYFVCNKEGFKASRKPIVEAVEEKLDKAWSTRRRILTRDNIDLVKAFRIMKELTESYDNVDAEGHLCRAFWADPICRKNYALFGDMVSFDTTFKTNRYNMIFRPFTRVDHHKKCITFVAAFISNEDIVSFEWVFRTFVKAMGGNEPLCLITDEDPAMKVSFPKVFPSTEHRFCMWHIMKKMPEKVCCDLPPDSDFLQKICKAVWSVEIELAEFEERWTKIYDKREMWIPAYFRDLFWCGIMRTTSRSESENNFYTKFTNPHLTLVEFYMRFQSALDAQRHTQGENDNSSKHKHPECKTRSAIEKFAFEVYTTTVFYEFQDEVELALFSCGLDGFKKEFGLEVYTIGEGCRVRKFDVLFNVETLDTSCLCKSLKGKGFLVSIWFGFGRQNIFSKFPRLMCLIDGV